MRRKLEKENEAKRRYLIEYLLPNDVGLHFSLKQLSILLLRTREALSGARLRILISLKTTTHSRRSRLEAFSITAKRFKLRNSATERRESKSLLLSTLT